MPILAAQISQTGLVDVVPNVAYISTNDTVAQVTTAGYLNTLVQAGYQFTEAMMALVSTKTTPTATPTAVSWFDVSFSGGNWSLVASSSTTTLSNANIFVGNASNVAADVPLSGDATMANTGALTIINNAITSAKINAAAVTLAKLAPGITPSHICVFGGTQANGGGSATVAITVTGALATDLPVVQIAASTNAVSIQKVTATSNTVTVIMSGDPGAATSLTYQVFRAAT